MRYGELFAGAGGMSLGLERAGLSCAFHAEIADFPRRVLRHRWPDVPLYGDVSTLDGRELVASHGAIDVLAGGSPCQDMSVAGKRAGLAGARSSLFYQQLRLWEETGATYLLWENVAGALSSNRGQDFTAVLSAIVGSAVVTPSDGWRNAGVVSGPSSVAAWRLLDAQWFGVPQRRLRVFVLGARAGGVDPAEVLLEPQGVRRHPPTRGEARQGTADSTHERAAFAIQDGDRQAGERGQGSIGVGMERDPMFTLHAGAPHAVVDAIAFDNRVQGEPSSVASCDTGSHGNHGMVMAFAPLQGGRSMPVTEECPTLEAGTGNKAPAILAYDTTQVISALNRSNPRAGDPDHPLAAQAHAPLVVSVTDSLAPMARWLDTFSQPTASRAASCRSNASG